MSWDSITGDSKILPSQGSMNEVKMESGKPKQVRLLFGEGNEQPYSYLEHTMEVETIENGQVVRAFRTVRCLKTTKNPNAFCPLCEGQQLKLRARNACNVWDFDLNQVQKLNQGDSVFKPIATTRKLGIDITGVNWAILKTGEGRNDTEYSATNLGPSPFALPADAQLFNIELDYAPHSIDDMKAIVESIGLNWDKVTVPPALVFPSLEEALAHVMPNGQHKGKTFQQMWNEDPSPKGMISFLGVKSNRINEEKAAAQVIMVNLGGANIEGVPRYGNGGVVTGNTPVAPAAQNTPVAPAPAPVQMQAPVTPTAPVQMQAPVTPTAPVQMQAPVAPVTPTAPVQTGNDRQGKINQINSLLSTKPAFISGGFTKVIDTMKSASGGKTNVTDFTDAELDILFKMCEEA